MKHTTKLTLVGIICFLLGSFAGYTFFNFQQQKKSFLSDQDQIQFLLGFVPLYDRTIQQPSRENLERLKNTLEPFLFKLLTSHFDQKTLNSKVTSLEVRRIEGLNPYQVSLQKLDAKKSLQKWTLSLQSIDQKKNISQISIRELSDFPEDHQFVLWKNQMMILKAPCLLSSAPIQFENLDVELDPFALDQVLIRRQATAGESLPESASLQFQCLEREFKFKVQASQTAQEHTSYLAVPIDAGRLVQKKIPSGPQKDLEKELGLDLEEGR